MAGVGGEVTAVVVVTDTVVGAGRCRLRNRPFGPRGCAAVVIVTTVVIVVVVFVLVPVFVLFAVSVTTVVTVVVVIGELNSDTVVGDTVADMTALLLGVSVVVSTGAAASRRRCFSKSEHG